MSLLLSRPRVSRTCRRDRAPRWSDVSRLRTYFEVGFALLQLAVLAAVPVFLVVEFGAVSGVALTLALVTFNIALYRPEWLREGIWAFAVIAFAAGVMVTGDAEAREPFYEATAQVVPALFIALAVQIQVFRSTRPRHAEDLRPAAVTALALVFAEGQALDVLASGEPASAPFRFVVGALAAAAVGIAMPVVLGPPPEPGEPPASKRAPVVSRPASVRDLLTLAILLIGARKRR